MHDPLLPLSARLLSRRDLTPDTALFRLLLEDARGVGPGGDNHRPGQFVMLSVPGAGEAPFSICHAPGGPHLELCIRRVGRLTERLFQLHPGALLGLRGPFGNGFPMERLAGPHLLLIAGGLGVAPLRSVWQQAVMQPDRFPRVTLLYGMREQAGMLFREELAELAQEGRLELRLAVDHPTPDDPLAAHPGNVGQLLAALALHPPETRAACCGPPVMYRGVSELLRRRGVYPQNVFLTFERRMACGIGQCGHCAIGYRYTCLDGPVFSAWEARGLREAWYTEA